MKKNLETKIAKICEKKTVKIEYDSNTGKSYINNAKLNLANFKLQPSYNDFKKAFKDMNDADILRLLVEYSTKFEWTDVKALEKQRIKEEKEQLKQNKIDEAKKAVELRTDESKMNDWEKLMIRDDKGYIDRTQKRNMAFFLDKYPDLYGCFRFNEFCGTTTFKGQIIEPHITAKLALLTEAYIGNNNTQWVNELTNMICHQNMYNPIKDALSKLPEWDGVKRMETFFIDNIGAYDTSLNKEITVKMFYAMFERLYRPGCRFYHMIITYDDTHGTGKTTILISLLEALAEFAGNTQEDSGIIALNDLGFDKDTVQCLNKAWIAYVDELAKFLKEEPEDVKKFITQTNDNARLSYEKLNKNFPRHCIFYGSTNTKEFIKDTTDKYERRWWIIECEGEKHESKAYWDKKLPTETKLQILAEAMHFYKENTDFQYNELSEKNEQALVEIQRGHTMVSKDEILGNKIMTILDFEYSTDIFDTYYQWKNEAMSLWDTHKNDRKYFTTSKSTSYYDVFFLKNDEKPGEIPGKNDENDRKPGEKTHIFLRKIPIIWVKQFIQEELGRMITDDNYINRLIDCKWMKNKNLLYTNGLRGCYTRNL